MFNHADAKYICSICVAIEGSESDDTWIKQNDIVFRDDLVMVFIGSKFIKGNEGHPLIVPLKHIENVYDLPAECGARIMSVARKTALALKQSRNCDGITFVQNNEPAGDQHAFHYHLHVIPRFEGDTFHQQLFQTYKSDPKERIKYADELRTVLNKL